ncbi:hypothetical protein DAETH_18560 [Deinococcus aetherius]|uniref:DUF2259 domain-containing protein n=1 Tax=Deinococcus aetherius TaxID=200252 RepID=A0ABN6RJY2_9DEIO|nr:DUF2259 domain-containing protein [Deinococcus aetherius]BDP41887.1 hypothetical protein DAETH_18560 [Deinococcus aetherius]
MRRLLLLALLALTPFAEAGNRQGVRRVTFSPDGTRALVVTGGVQDGSGFSTAGLTVVETGTGRTLREVSATSQTGTVEEVVASLLRRERALLARNGLTPGQTARPVFTRPSPVQAPVWTEGLRAGTSATLPVRLWTRPVPVRLSVRSLPSPCRSTDLLPPGEEPAGFTLDVKGQTLHLDRGLPASRECAARYALERVYVRGNRAVFVLRAYTPGFEGPNAEPVVVAATLR